MKTAFFLIFSFAPLFAADQSRDAAKQPPAEPAPDQAQSEQVKKLGSVTWDLDRHKLVWVVQQGTMSSGEFKATSEQRYEISPDEAKMAAAGEQRGFDENEAASLQHLLDVLSVYCAQSVVWWDEGEGTPVGPDAAPVKPDTPRHQPAPGKSVKPPDQKPVRVDDSKPDKMPRRPIPETESVALIEW